MSQIRRKVWLAGEPHFSLNYGADAVPVDLQAFRPDPRTHLKGGVKYWAKLHFVQETSPLGTPAAYLRKVTVRTERGTIDFVKVR